MKLSSAFSAACVGALLAMSCITKGDNTIITGRMETDTDAPDASVSIENATQMDSLDGTDVANLSDDERVPVVLSTSPTEPEHPTEGSSGDGTDADTDGATEVTAGDSEHTQEAEGNPDDAGEESDVQQVEPPDAAVEAGDTEVVTDAPSTEVTEEVPPVTEDDVTPLLTNGEACTSASECASNQCEETSSADWMCCQDSCGSGFTCEGAGTCVARCPMGAFWCDGACVDPSSDGEYCGAGPDCSGGEVCEAGEQCSSATCNPYNPFGDVVGGSSGQTARYWDCCKPSCAWSANTSSPALTCNAAGDNLGVSNALSACDGGPGSMCGSYAPWALNELVAFGYVATASSSGDLCGKCYHLQFTGTSSVGTDSGSARIANKTMVVRGIQTSGTSGFFDLLIPGGGVGLFNACAAQWGTTNLGANYGGFLAACQSEPSHDARKSCVRNFCENVFVNRAELLAGCLWFVDWFEVANQPSMNYKEIACPPELQ